MKKHVTISAAIAALTSVTGSIPLPVAGAYFDAMTGTEIVKGVGFTLLDKNFVSPANVKIDIYNVNDIAPNENGVYDLTSLTPVKSFTTPESEAYTPYSLGLDSGKYVAKITPPAEYVINNYYTATKNATNEVVFDVNESISWISLGFLSTNSETADNLTVCLQTHDGYPVGNVTAKVIRTSLDGTVYELGEYKSDENGVIVCPADVTDELPAGSIYSFELLDLPDEYTVLYQNKIEIQAIEGLNSQTVTVGLKEHLGTCNVGILHTDYAQMIPNCPILVTDVDGKTYKYQTGEDGMLRISDLPDGKYTLAYNGDDENLTFTPETFNINSAHISDCIVYVSNIEVAGIIEIYGASNITVNVVNTTTNEVVGTYKLNEDGKAVTDTLCTGVYRIEATETPEGITVESATVEITANSVYSVSLEQSIENEKIGFVDIYVMDENGDAISELNVHIFKETGEYVQTNVLSDEGALYAALPYGNYFLQIVNIPSQYQSEDGTFEKAFAVNSESILVPIVLQKATEILADCSIDVEVWNVDTKSYVTNQKVTILNDKNVVCGEAMTNENGLASFTDLPYGTYHFILSEDSGAYILDNQSVTVNEDHKMALHTVQAKTLTSTLVLSAQCANADLVKNLSISLYKNEKLVGTYTMENGTVSIDKLTAGTYTIVLNDEISGYKVTSDLEVVIKTSDKTINKTLVFDTATGTFSASVLTEDGEPVKSVYVYLTDENGNIVANDYTNEKGEVLFDVSTGTWIVNVEVPDGYALIESQKVEIKDGETTELNLTTRMVVGSVKINVIDEYSDPIVNAEVAVLNIYGETVWTGITDETGVLTVENLPLGVYTIKAIAYDNMAYNPPANKALEIMEEKEYIVDFVFDRIQDKVTTGSMTLTLKDDDGNVLTEAEDVVVALYDSNDVMIDVIYVEAGVASFENLAEGNYKAKLYNVNAPYILSDKSDVSFTIKAEDELTADMIVYKGHGSVNFNITDSEFNTGLDGIEIELFQDGNSIGVYTSKDGLISISELEQGSYTYKITNMPDEYESIADGTFVVENGETTNVELLLTAKTGQGIINVVDTNGNLITTPVRLTLQHENGVTSYSGIANNGVLNTGWLRAGKYTLAVETELDGWTLKNVDEVTIVADETNTYNVVFEKNLGSASIKVEVQNLEGNIGLANVEVEVYSDNNELFGTYKTDAHGNISVTEMPIGKYTAKIVEESLPSGYALLTGTDFNIVKNETSNVIVYALREVGTLQIRVQDDNEMALANIKVLVKDASGNLYKEAETNAYGNITLKEIPTGTYTLEFANTQDGYSVDGDFVAVIKSGEITNNTLSLKRDVGSLKIQCSKAVANVFFELYDGDTMVADGYTDANGEAIVDNIPTGNYTLKVTSVPSKYKKPADSTITILRDTETLWNLDLVEKSAKVSVEFKYQVTGYPTSGVEFIIKTVDGKEIGTYTTDETGIVNVQLGVGYYYVETTKVPDGYDLPAKELIQIKNEDDKTVLFELVETKYFGTLALSCIDADNNNPLVGAEIVLYDNNGSVYKTFTTDEFGQIYSDEIDVGSYSAIITMADYTTQTITFDIDKNGFFAQTIYMEKVQELSTLTVVVCSDTNEPLANSTVYLRDTTGNIVKRGYTDDDGVLVLKDIPFGNYTLSAEAEGYKTSGRIDTIIASEEEVATLKLSPITTGTASISVVDSEGDFIPNAVISIDGHNNYHNEVTTNAIGMAMINELEAGEYTFTVKVEGYVEYSQKFTINANTTNYVDIVLTNIDKVDTGSAEVIVVDADGNALTDATVILSADTMEATLTTDENGIARFDNLLVGEYSIVVSKDGYDSKTVHGVVEKDSTTKVKMTLTKTVTTGNLKVTVCDEDGSALKDVSVVVGDKTLTTDENGQVTFDGLEAGDYIVKLSKDGYVTKELPVTISAKATVELNATLVREVTVGTVNFSVKDGHGNALENATVVISNGETEQTLTTDSNGFATIDLDFGEYSITISKDGYVSQTSTLNVESQKVYTITATLQKEITKGNLEVTVQDIDGNALIGATVRVTNGTDDYTLIADENGFVSFEGLPAGEYTMTASMNGYISQKTSVTIVENQITRITAKLAKDVTTGSLTVIVENTDGTRLANASVLVSNGVEEITLTTDENGEITVEELAEGEWNVSVSANGYVAATYKATIQAKKNVSMKVTLAKEIITGDLNVKVSDTDGNVLSGATVEVVCGDFSKRYSTDENGNVSFTDLEAGEYTVTISKNGYIEQSTTVTIEAKKIVSIEVALEKEVKKGNLDVTVNNHDGTPAAGAIVTIRDKNGLVYSTYTTDENGKVAIEDMMIGEYQIEAYLEIDSEYGIYIEDKFEITDKETTQITLTLPEPQLPVTTGNAKITVVNTDGNALANATVEISNGTEYFEMTTDVNGMVSFTELNPGVYSVKVTMNGYISHETSIEIVAYELTETTITLKAITTGSLEFSVVDIENNPLANASVTIFNRDGFEKTLTTDENGKIFLSELEAGKYTVVVNLDGYLSGDMDVVIEATKITSEKMTMSKAPILGNATVKVSDIDGNNLSDVNVRLYNDNHEYTLTTDENGIVQFEDIVAGEYMIVTSKDGYIETSNSVVVTQDETVTVEVVMEKEITTGDLNVWVYDNEGNALKNASIVIDNQIFITGEEGYAFVDNLEQGEHSIVISKDGYVTKHYTVTIIAKNTAILKATLEKEITTGTLNVNVTDMNGDALTEATITIDGNTHIVDENGKLTLTDLEAGKYTIVVSKNGYISESYDVTINANETTVLNVDLEEEVTVGQLEGTIQTHSGAGLESAKILIENGDFQKELISDENGEFALDNLEAGTYSYTVTLDGYETSTGTFTITANQTTYVVVAMMPTPVKGIAHFDVTNTDGEKLEGAIVTVMKDGIIAFETDVNGSVMIPDLGVGTYSYSVSKDGYITSTGEFTIDDTAITHVPVVLEKEPVKSELSITIVDEDGNKLEGVTVKVEGTNYNQVFTTDKDGNITVSDLLIDEYRVSALLTGYESAEKIVMLSESGADVTLTMKKIELPKATGDMFVTVKDENGKNVAFADVFVESNDGTYYETWTTDENGQVLITLPIGEYRVVANKEEYVADGTRVEIVENETIEVELTLERIFVEISTSAELHIKNQFGENVENARVVVYDENGNKIFDDVLVDQSTLSLLDLVPGKYTAMISKNNHETAMIEWTSVEGENTIVEVTLKEIVEEVKAGALEVLVFDKDGNVLDDVLITILNADGSRYGSWTVDRYGAVSLTAMPVGEYSVYASYQGIDSDKIYFEIVGGQIKTVSIVIDDTKKEEEKPNTPSKPNKPNNPGGDKENIQTGDETLPKFGLLALLSAIGAFVSRKKKK